MWALQSITQIHWTQNLQAYKSRLLQILKFKPNQTIEGGASSKHVEPLAILGQHQPNRQVQ